MQGSSTDFSDKPYYAVSDFYKKKFGAKVFKIPVALSGKCPNMKDGSGLKTCIFCDEWGSFAYPENQERDLREQIELHRKRVAERYNSKHFFVYFQAYTTTYTQVQRVRAAFQTALEFEGVVGIVIGTRPDCLSPALLETFNDMSKKTFMAVELGVQSFDNKQLEWMRRGHTAEQSEKAILRIQKECPDVNLGIHLMFGWPGETLEDMRLTAKRCNELEVHNVKLHNLHVLKKTDLAKEFQSGHFKPIELEEYAEYVSEFLVHLSPEIAVHRLVATASRWDELVSPQWTRNKMQNYQYMVEHLQKKNLYQGQKYETL
ncbi:MAG: TIGR01212 family radical SAM protein [Pseudomonadota bacterium]